MPILIAVPDRVVVVDPETGEESGGEGFEGRPTCLAADPHTAGRAWAGTDGDGVFRSDDAGASWRPAGLEERRIMAVAVSPAGTGVMWAGTEPSAVWRLDVGGAAIWRRTRELGTLPSSSEWSFPPRPETHHVRWIQCHPEEPGRLWVAVEAGALVRTVDGGESWRDRVPGGPRDTHELAVHAAAPDRLRSAAGDGYFESDDGGDTWSAPGGGLEVGYLRSVAIDPGDPDGAVVSAASGPGSAYVAGRGDGRVYRRVGDGPWRPVTGWPDPPDTIAPLLASGRAPGELWAADERGLHGSDDGGMSWSAVHRFGSAPDHLRGLAVLQA